MAIADLQAGLTPSLFDRLIETDSTNRLRRGYHPDQYLQAVRRDLEALLNTRPPAAPIPEDFTQTRRSILNYGLPDLTFLPASTPQQREQIGRLIEGVILQFEPRLRDVHAKLLESQDETDVQTVRFQINARLVVEPNPDVVFATTMDLETGHASIQLGDS